MTDILSQIVAEKREEIAALKAGVSLERLRDEARQAAPALDFVAALRGPRPRGDQPRGQSREANIIAEIKLRSPSRGEFPWQGDPVRQARAYEQGGAKAISVVTDGPFFGGSAALLQAVKSATTLPVLQKDFVLEPYQVHYARSLGADAVLLIARLLPGTLLGELVGLSGEVGLATLVEVVDLAELGRATAAGAAVIGVNNRDLRTFRTDVAHTLELLPHFTSEQVAVTESGFHTWADVEPMLRAGADAFLIGEALMVAPDPAALLKTLRGESRGEAAVKAAVEAAS